MNLHTAIAFLVLFSSPLLAVLLDRGRPHLRRWFQSIDAKPASPPSTWCAGCDRLLPAVQMGWSDGGDYRCTQCLNITTSSGTAELQAQIDMRQELGVIERKVVPPKGGGGVVLPHQRRPEPPCLDCAAFGRRHCHTDTGKSFPIRDWPSSEAVKG